MRRTLDHPILHSISRVLSEILRPLGQIVLFVAASGFILSAFVLIIALLLQNTQVNQVTMEKFGTSLFTYTLVNLPQVLIDGVTIGFVYASVALGYTMVYGVLEFINFAHSEIFAVGGFVGLELLIFGDGMGWLSGPRI